MRELGEHEIFEDLPPQDMGEFIMSARFPAHFSDDEMVEIMAEFSRYYSLTGKLLELEKKVQAIVEATS